MNYIDLIVTILIVLAFIRGFSGGLYRSLSSLITSIAAFLVAMFLAGPLTGYFEAKYGVLSKTSQWWLNAIRLVPGVSEPYDPASFDRIFEGMGSLKWAGPVRSILKQNIYEVEALAGAAPTWGQILSLALSHLLLTGVVFLVLLAVARMTFMLFLGTLSFANPASFGLRMSGGLLEACITVLWLSLILGVLSPLLYSDMLGPVRQAVSDSRSISMLLGIHSWIWPFVLGKLGIRA